MSSKSDNGYQKLFIKLALRRLPHHMALYVAAKTRCQPLVRMLDGYAKKRIVGKVNIRDFSDDELQRYLETTKDAELWHGTGRHQHSDGNIVDVLEGIVARGGIRPVEDVYAIFSGGETMTSTSLTRLRIIARSYADKHGEGIREPHRYGDALLWTSYHYGLFYAKLYTFHYPRVKKHYRTWHKLAHDETGDNTWGKKSNQAARDVWDVFGLGSDIPHNYPIIFGIKKLADTVDLPKSFSEYEVRTDKLIGLDDITHIEVPQAKVDEVKKLLAHHKVNIPVESIELGELVASQTPFSTLVGLGKG